jgi:hypothetical protein
MLPPFYSENLLPKAIPLNYQKSALANKVQAEIFKSVGGREQAGNATSGTGRR